MHDNWLLAQAEMGNKADFAVGQNDTFAFEMPSKMFLRQSE